MNSISHKYIISSMPTEEWMKQCTPTMHRQLLDAQAKRRFAIRKVQRQLLSK